MLYAIGDVLLLASKVSLDDYPKLKPFAKLLSDAEKMVVLSPNRMIWGALLGVFATPLVLAGFWQVYQGIEWRKCIAQRWQLRLLFAIASIIGAFVHGTFYYMGEYIQALNKVEDGSQSVIADMIARHRKVLIITLCACPDLHSDCIDPVLHFGGIRQNRFPRLDGGDQPCHNDHRLADPQTHPSAIRA